MTTYSDIIQKEIKTLKQKKHEKFIHRNRNPRNFSN